MKHLKILGLLAIAATAFMAFAATASATIVTSPKNTTYTSTIKATSTNSALDGAFTTVTCSGSTAEGKVEKHGAGVNVSGSLTTLDFTGCNFPVTVVANGSLEISSTNTVTSKNAKISIETSVGTCVFTTVSTGTVVGTLTESEALAGKTAVMDINSAKIPRTEGNFLCGTSGTWTGNYTVVTPDYLDVD